LERHASIHRFVKMLVAFRARRDVAVEDSPLTLNELLDQAQLQWHGVKLGGPDWGEDSHSIAFTLKSLRGRFVIHAMINAYWEPLSFELPCARWRRWIDTSLPSPHDIAPWEEAETVPGPSYVAAPRSVALLVEFNA
jgi:glycogen operon protein